MKRILSLTVACLISHWLSAQVLVKNINPSPDGSFPNKLISFNDKLIFDAFHPDFGFELFISDGTEEGTELLLDIESGIGSSNPVNFTIHGDLLYFTATTTTGGNELWATDGTTEGTFLVKDIEVG